MAKLRSKQLKPEFTGSFSISGSLNVHGQTILDSKDNTVSSLIVKGKTEYVNQTVNIQNVTKNAQVDIEGLGTIANVDQAGVIDLGEGFNG